METAPPDKEGHSDLPSDLGFALAPLETDPAPVVTRSSEVSRVEPTSAMVTRSRAREGRGISVEYTKHRQNRNQKRDRKRKYQNHRFP